MTDLRTDSRLTFAEDAYDLLSLSTDHVALKKLCDYYLKEIRAFADFRVKYTEVLMLNDSLSKKIEYLEKELIDYKLKFEDISLKLNAYEEFKKAAEKYADRAEEIGLQFANQKQELPSSDDAFIETDDVSQWVMTPDTRTHQEKVEDFAKVLKEELRVHLENNPHHYYVFKKHKSEIQEFLTGIVKAHKKEWLAGEEIPALLNANKSLSFEHLLAHEKKDSIFQITAYGPGEIYQLTPQSVVESMLRFRKTEAPKYSLYVLKEIRDLISNYTIKLGVKNYILMGLSVVINKTKEAYLENN